MGTELKMNCVEIESAHEALILLKQDQAFDIALIDSYMHEIHGADLAMEMRKSGINQLTVALLASGSDNKIRYTLDEGIAQAILHKPAKKAALIDILLNSLENKPTSIKGGVAKETVKLGELCPS